MNIRLGIAALLAGVATLTIAALLADVATSSKPLINVGSRKCFAPTPQDGHNDWAGLPIQQRTCAPDSDYATVTEYEFVPIGYVLYNEGPPWYCPWCIHLGAEGYFIKNSVTGLCLDARDGAKSDGSVVQQWTCKGKNDRSMVWYVEPGDFPDAYKIKNFNSDLCLDVRSGSHDEGAQLQQYHCTSNNAAQNFWQTAPFSLGLNGDWTDGSTRTAHIYQGPLSPLIKIDMSDFGRPWANGSIAGGVNTISVTFPDDQTYTGQIVGNTIRWSNGSVWVRKP
jgi:hypothetical protein